MRQSLIAALLLVAVESVMARGGQEQALQSFPVRDFGAVPDGKADSGPALRKALAAALAAAGSQHKPVEVVLEAGTYRIAPDRPRGPALAIHQAANLTVRGAGAATKLVMTDPAAGVVLLSSCRQIVLRDFAIDYDPVPFCQGTIRAIDAAAGSFDLEVATGYPAPDAPNFVQALEPFGKWGMVIDPATRRIRAGTPDHYMTPRWEQRSGRLWRFFTSNEHHRRNLAHMRVGDAYVHLARGYGSAVLAHGCDSVRIEGILVHASPGLAVGLVGNRGEIVVRGLEVRFAPGTDRLLSTDADGVHCQQNRTGPIIENCYFEGMADDAINIYAPPNVLREIRTPTEWLVSPGALVVPGDRLQVLDPIAGRLRGQVRALEVKAEGRAFLLTLEKPLAGAVAGADHRSADTLYDLDACGAGFRIRNNRMNGNRRYGCLLRAGGGLVENNTFEDTTGAGIVLTNEPDWPEGPIPWGITIRGNRFLRGGTCLGYADAPHGAALAVRATRLGHQRAEAECIAEVTIDKNEFYDRAGTALYVSGATNVTLRQNRVTASSEVEPRRPGPALRIERSSHVTLIDNTVIDMRSGTTAALEIGPDVPPGEAGVRLLRLDARLGPHAQAVTDRRRPSDDPPRR